MRGRAPNGLTLTRPGGDRLPTSDSHRQGRGRAKCGFGDVGRGLRAVAPVRTAAAADG